MPVTLTAVRDLGLSNQSVSNGPHGVHHVISTVTPNGRLWCVWLLDAIDPNSSVFNEGALRTCPFILKYSDNGGVDWTTEYTSLGFNFHKVQLVQDWRNREEVYVTAWPALVYSTAPQQAILNWKPNPNLTWEPRPYTYSSADNTFTAGIPVGDLYESSDPAVEYDDYPNNWWTNEYNATGSTFAASNTQHNYPATCIIQQSIGDFQPGDAIVMKWNSGPNVNVVNHTGGAGQYPGYCQWAVRRANGTWTQTYRYTSGAPYGRTAYNFIFPRPSGGFIHFAVRDVLHSVLVSNGVAGEGDENGPDPTFKNLWAIDKVVATIHTNLGDQSPTQVELDSVARTVAVGSPVASNTFMEMSHCWMDHNNQYHLLYWYSNDTNSYAENRNRHLVVDEDGAIVSDTDQPSGLATAGGTRSIFQDANNTFYMTEIWGSVLKICTATNASGTTWTDPQVLTLDIPHLAASRVWVPDRRSGSQVNQANIYLFYVGTPSAGNARMCMAELALDPTAPVGGVTATVTTPGNTSDGYFSASPGTNFQATNTRVYMGPAAGSPSVQAFFRTSTGLPNLAGATMIHAYPWLHGFDSEDAGLTTMRIYLEKTASPAVPTSVADVESRTLTTAYTDWSGMSLGLLETGHWQRGPDCATVWQELVDAHTPTAVTAHFRSQSGAYVVAQAYDNDPSKAMYWELEYIPGAASSGVTVSPTTAAVGITGWPPTIIVLPQTLTPTTAEFNITRFTPDVLASSTLIPGAASFVVTSFTPAITSIATVSATPANGRVATTRVAAARSAASGRVARNV